MLQRLRHLSRPSLLVYAMLAFLLCGQGARLCVHSALDGDHPNEHGAVHLESPLADLDDHNDAQDGDHIPLSVILAKALGTADGLALPPLVILLVVIWQARVLRLRWQRDTRAPPSVFLALRPPLRAPPLGL